MFVELFGLTTALNGKDKISHIHNLPNVDAPGRVGHLLQWKSLTDSHHSQSLPCTGRFCGRIQLGDGTCPPLWLHQSRIPALWGSVGSTVVREQQPLLSTVLAYMQLLEDYSEPQPSMFYQTPQSEHIYQQKNKMLMEVYGFSDSFCGTDSTQELAPPPALPPKQRQLVSSSPSVSLALLQVTRAVLLGPG